MPGCACFVGPHIYKGPQQVSVTPVLVKALPCCVVRTEEMASGSYHPMLVL